MIPCALLVPMTTCAPAELRRRSAQLVDFLRTQEAQARDTTYDEEIAYWKLAPAAAVSAGLAIYWGGRLLGVPFPGSGN